MRDMNFQGTVAHCLVKYRNHLEFTGYNIIEENENSLFGSHCYQVPLWLTKIGERGVLVNTAYHLPENVGRADILEFINSLNAEFLFMKAYLNYKGCLRLETFSAGEYDRRNFSILLHNIEFDINTFFANELTATYIQ